MFAPDRIVESHWVAERRGLLRFRCEQPWYSIFARDIERSVLPTCQRYGMGVITWSPLDGGWLTGKYRSPQDITEKSRIAAMQRMRGNTYDPESETNLHKFRLVEALSKLAADAGLSLAHMAIAFTQEHPAVTSTIIGPRTMDQLEDLLACADLRLTKDILDEIDRLVPPGTSVNGVDPTSRSIGMSKRNRRRSA